MKAAHLFGDVRANVHHPEVGEAEEAFHEANRELQRVESAADDARDAVSAALVVLCSTTVLCVCFVMLCAEATQLRHYMYAGESSDQRDGESAEKSG